MAFNFAFSNYRFIAEVADVADFDVVLAEDVSSPLPALPETPTPTPASSPGGRSLDETTHEASSSDG